MEAKLPKKTSQSYRVVSGNFIKKHVIMIKLNSLFIENFRHIHRQNIEFGKYLTVITGLNGTGKSSILGWIAQLCDYKGKEKSVLENYFKENYRNVFRFCPQNDYDKEYDVTFYYENSTESLIEEQKKLEQDTLIKLKNQRNVTERILMEEEKL